MQYVNNFSLPLSYMTILTRNILAFAENNSVYNKVEYCLCSDRSVVFYNESVI